MTASFKRTLQPKKSPKKSQVNQKIMPNNHTKCNRTFEKPSLIIMIWRLSLLHATLQPLRAPRIDVLHKIKPFSFEEEEEENIDQA